MFPSASRRARWSRSSAPTAPARPPASTCSTVSSRPTRGEIRLGDASLVGLPPHRIWRLGVGRTFQVTATFGSMSVRENVQAALLSHHRRNYSFWPRAAALWVEEANALLERVGMERHAAASMRRAGLRRPEASGAGAGARQPPAPSLDGRAHRRHGTGGARRADGARGPAAPVTDHLAVLFTEHDMSVVFGFATRVIVLHLGQVIAAGSSDEVRAEPAGPRGLSWRRLKSAD